MITFDVYSMPYTVVPGSRGGTNIHQYLVTRAARMRNTVEGGHRLRWKADTRMVIADT